MLRSASILLTALLQFACVRLPKDEFPTHLDVVRQVAQDLRWTKQTQGVARIEMSELTPPVGVLAVPPGMHGLDELESLVPSEQGRELLRQRFGARPMTTENPTLYIFATHQTMSFYLHDEASISKAIGVWKERMRDFEILLERHGDDVQIVGLR